MTLLFDTETDHLLEKATKVHCLVTYNVETGEISRFNSVFKNIEQGLKLLESATQIVGHNSLGFDVPVLQKLYPSFQPKRVLDTLVFTRYIWADLKDRDFQRLSKDAEFPRKLIGSHSLKAWGYRLKVFKGDFKENNTFENWSQEMEDYCVQDVMVTKRLWELIQGKTPDPRSVDLEHQFAELIYKQEKNGFRFDVRKAQELYAELAMKRVEIEQELQRVFEPKIEVMKKRHYLFFDKVFATKGEASAFAKTWAKEQTMTQKDALALIKEGEPFKKEIPFNCGSREEIARRFKEKYGWEAKEFTPDGKPKMDESILSNLDFPEAKPLLEYLTIQKRIGQLAEGKEAWIKLERNGRIHGRVNTNGAVTGRCTHSNPNIAQVPAVRAAYGKECRSLFTVDSGNKLVGCDASGLELRCLAHYMAKWDDGAYAKELLEGDIHTANQTAAGLPTRDDAKTFIYAFLYGAGDVKIGSIIGKGQNEGKVLRENFLRKTPALRYLKEAVEKASSRGYLVGLDGRHLVVRSQHAALNTLLQSAGALVMKKAACFLWEAYRGVFPWKFVANIHDEWQIEVEEASAETIGKASVQAIRDSGDYFNFRCPLDGEFRIGNNWAETH
jgi:DNA polymerase I-like protein with 3'-5' exonuclease and polymerase domains